MEPLLDMMGLRRLPVLWILGNHRTWGGKHRLGIIYLYIMSLSPPCCLMALSLVMSEFLNLVDSCMDSFVSTGVIE